MNRIAKYLPPETAVEPLYRVLALGDRVVELCRTRWYYDAVAEADCLSREVAKLALLVPGVRTLVVLDPQGNESCRFDLGLAKPVETHGMARDLVLLAAWLLVAAVVGFAGWRLLGE